MNFTLKNRLRFLPETVIVSIIAVPLHKEWERPGEVKSSVSIPYEKVEEISRKLNVIVYETQQSADSDGLAFKQSIAKSKQCYVLLRIMRKIVKGKGDEDVSGASET